MESTKFLKGIFPRDSLPIEIPPIVGPQKSPLSTLTPGKITDYFDVFYNRFLKIVGGPFLSRFGAREKLPNSSKHPVPKEKSNGIGKQSGRKAWLAPLSRKEKPTHAPGTLRLKNPVCKKKAFLARIRTRKASDRQNWLLGIAKRLTPAP